MTSLVYKFVLHKTGLSSLIKIGNPDEDPYNEIIPEEELKFWQRKGSKRRKDVPTFLSVNDQKVLTSVRNRAYRMDLQLRLCGVRVGWGGIIGLIPAIGDIINCVLSLAIIRKAKSIDGGLPADIISRMTTNVVFDFLIGLIPIVGDLVCIAYKANTRNFQMLEKYLLKKYGVSVPAHNISHDPLPSQPIRYSYHNDDHNAIRLPNTASSSYEMTDQQHLDAKGMPPSVPER